MELFFGGVRRGFEFEEEEGRLLEEVFAGDVEFLGG